MCDRNNLLLGNKRASKAEQRRKADMPQSACAPKWICHKAHALPKGTCYKGNALQSGCTRLVANWTVRDKRLLLTIDGRKTRQGRLVGLAGEEQLGRETICEATTHLLRGAMGLDKSGQEGGLSEADKPSGWPSFLLPVFLLPLSHLQLPQRGLIVRGHGRHLLGIWIKASNAIYSHGHFNVLKSV